MLKKNQKIINSVLRPQKEQLSKVAFDTETGFYYALDGFRLVRIEPAEFNNAEIPVFESDTNVTLPNYKKYCQDANEVEYTEVTIPYTIKQIKEWYKENQKRKERLPFTLGKKINGYKQSGWFGINPQFLIDAMETTGSNKISIPDRGASVVMQGKGYLWIIMSVLCKNEYEKNHKMTAII